MMRSLAAVAALAALASAARAEDAYPTHQILSTGQTILGETITYPTTGPAQVTASIVTILPGADTIPHRHGTPMFAYLLEGTLTVDYGPEGTRTFTPGDSFMEAMSALHRGRNLGTVPVRILAVSLGAEGASNVILAPR
jgi:quercetin dioxygenase-like cupin family protein